MLTDSTIMRREELLPSFRVEPPEDWRALLRTRTHMLVTGPRTALSAFARAARSELREPVASMSGNSPLFFLEGARTLILNDVHLLDHAGQQRLLAWMSQRRNADTQVLSLTTARVFEFVAKGFDANLYYRLNTIYLELQDT
jgi:hypothetical protein